MTIASDKSMSGPYLGNGATKSFEYKFKIFDNSHVVVTLHKADGAAQILTQGAHYSVTGVGNEAGGQVVMVNAPLSGQQVTIRRNVPFVQEIDLENQGAFYAEVIERGFDAGAMRDQQLKEKLDRAITVPENVDPAAKDALVRDIGLLAEQAGDIGELVAMKAAITEILGIKAQVNTVAGKAVAVGLVAANIDDVSTVSNNVSDIIAVKNNGANINAAAGNWANINAVASNMTNVQSVAANMGNINAVKNMGSNIQTVVNNETKINNVAANISNINDVAANGTNIASVKHMQSDIGEVVGIATNINSVVNNASNINTMAARAEDIITIAENMDDVTTVANMNVAGVTADAQRAHQWAVRAEDSSYNDGVNPAGFSAYHWAQKAQASAAAASSIADFNPDDYLKKTGGTVTGALNVTGHLVSNIGIKAGTGSEIAEYWSNGNIYGSIWKEWHTSGFAKQAIGNHIETRAQAIADARINALVNGMIDAKINAFKASNPTFTSGIKVQGAIKATKNIHAYVPVTQIDEEDE